MQLWLIWDLGQGILQEIGVWATKSAAELDNFAGAQGNP
jgi:hypothetical protein